MLHRDYSSGILMVHIDSYDFGRFVVDGKKHESNIAIVKGKVFEMRYLPQHELLISDLKLLLDAKPKTIIIGTGFDGVMKVKPEISAAIKKAGIELLVLPTGQAREKFNELSKTKDVAAFLHNTC